MALTAAQREALRKARAKRDGRSRDRLDRMASKEAQSEDVRKALKFVTATILSLVGRDEDESFLLQQIKGSIGNAPGELVQDIMLFIVDLLEDLRGGLRDGKLTGGEISGVLFSAMGNVGEIIADAEAIER